MIVYLVKNKLNKKVYVGQTNERKKDYFCGGTIINRAIKKHGKDGAFGHAGVSRRPPTKSVRKKMSAAQIKYASDPKNKIELSNRRKKFCSKDKGKEVARVQSEKLKKFFSKEKNRKLQSEKIKKYFSDPLNRKKFSDKMKIAMSKPENKIKNSEAQKRRYSTKDGMAKGIISISKMHRHNENPTVKKQIKEKKDRCWASPDKRKLQSELIKNGLIGKIHRMAKHVVKISLDGFIIGEFNSYREAAKSAGISDSRVKYCVNGRTKSAGGYIWK